MNPSVFQEELQRALAHHQAGRLAEAERRYARLRRSVPNNFDLVHLSGTLALQLGRHAEAAKALNQARRLGPASAVCAMRHGIALAALGLLGEAEAALREALALSQDLPEAWLHLGAVLGAAGRLDDGAAAFQRAIALRPDYAEAHDRLGALLTGWKGHAAAEPCFRRAVQADPRRATAWCNLGVCLLYRGRLGEALDCFARALQLDPALAHAHTARGLALERCYRLAEAVEAYTCALRLQPANAEAWSSRLMGLQYMGLPREAMAREHREFGRAIEGAARAGGRAAFANVREPERRLRVGFLSPDLHRHAVAYFLEPILAHLDRGQFEVVLYHDHAVTDAMSDRLRSLADRWISVAGQTNAALERLIRADGPDLLVDLAGHTGFNRLPLFARRLAPVQATYLGYPDTTGLAAMDYRLVDAVTDPAPAADALCSERLVRFAPTAWSYCPPPTAPEPAADRSGPVAFGCFNNFAKVTDSALSSWSRLLAAVPGSRLALKGAGFAAPELAAAVRGRLTAAGIAGDRVELLERTETLEAHLAAYGGIDLALDTFPYHGTTTTCEALWMGVPVVALAGDRHASRVGASLLAAVGHPEWIASDAADYVRIAAEVAASRPRTRAAREELRAAVRRSALCDHPAQARRFGSALRAMWRTWCAQAQAAA
jgi:predicted O-linked N-acetylglucosamine transferase (SPINDLY family)